MPRFSTLQLLSPLAIICLGNLVMFVFLLKTYERNGGEEAVFPFRSLEKPGEFLGLIRNEEWRYLSRSLGNRFKRNLLEAGETEEELNCSDLLSGDISSQFLNSGWTKTVYEVKHRVHGDLAVKVVNLNGRQMEDCLNSGVSYENCHGNAVAKMVKEIGLLRNLKHPNIIKILGYCIPRNPSVPPRGEGFEGRVAVITELAKPLDLIRFLQLNWEDRLQVLHSLAHLFDFLSKSPLGSLRIADFRAQQLVLTKEGNVKLVDLDDLIAEQPSCSSDCQIDPHSQLRVKCGNNTCQNFNEAQNLLRGWSLFFQHLLPAGAPPELGHEIRILLQELKNLELNAEELKNTIDSIVDRYRNGVWSHWTQASLNSSSFESAEGQEIGPEGDFVCQGSRNNFGCELSVGGVGEAKEICASLDSCKGFVWTSQHSWTGRNIAHFKNAVNPLVPAATKDTVFYARNR